MLPQILRLMPLEPGQVLFTLCRTHCITAMHHSSRTSVIHNEHTCMSAQHYHTSSVLDYPRGQNAVSGIRKQRRGPPSSVDGDSTGDIFNRDNVCGTAGTYIVGRKSNIDFMKEMGAYMPKDMHGKSSNSQDSLKFQGNKHHFERTLVKEFVVKNYHDPFATANHIESIQEMRNKCPDKRAESTHEINGSRIGGDDDDISMRNSSKEVREPKASHAFVSSETNSFVADKSAQIRARKETNHWKKNALKKGSTTRTAEWWKKRQEEKRVLQDIPSAGNDILFGIAPCWLALQQKKRVLHRIFISPSFQKSERHEVRNILAATDNQVEVKVVHRNELDRLSGDRPHQGICMETSPLEYYTLSARKDVLIAQLETLKPKCNSQHPPLWLALDQVKDPMNLGAVLRSSYFLGVGRIITCVQNSCPLSPVVSKASSGVMEVEDVYAAVDMPVFLQCMVSLGWQVIGAYGSTSEVGQDCKVNCVPCEEFALTQPTVLVVGNEGFGIRPEVAAKCSKFLTIQPGRKLHLGIDSLNVSVATGILLHSLLRREK